MQTTYAFRVDGGSHLGSGHVMRSLALANALRSRGCRIVWITRPQRGNLIPYLRHNGHEVLLLPRGKEPISAPLLGESTHRTDPTEWLGAPPTIDAHQTLRALKERRIRPDVLVVDHYGIDERWESLLRPQVGRIVVIDDLGNRRHECDVLIDATLGRSAYDYRSLLPKESAMHLGGAFALLRPEFASLRAVALQRRRQTQGVVRRLLIHAGSADAANLTTLALEALSQCEFSGEIDIVLGRHAPHRESVEQLLESKFPEAQLHIGSDQVAPLIAEADLAIGAGGVSAWERCALGLPSLIVTVAPNQEGLALGLASRGAATLVGSIAMLSADDLASHTTSALQDPDGLTLMGMQAATLCDGLGAPRVALLLAPMKTKDEKPVTLRPVEATDVDLIYRWQSDPATRQYARDPSPPSYDEHRQWFAKRLSDPTGYFFIIEYAGEPAGVLRCDAKGPVDTFELSIFVDPSFYRRGIAEAALKVARRLLPWATLEAVVLPENEASQRLFEKAGYTSVPEGFVSPPHPTLGLNESIPSATSVEGRQTEGQTRSKRRSRKGQQASQKEQPRSAPEVEVEQSRPETVVVEPQPEPAPKPEHVSQSGEPKVEPRPEAEPKAELAGPSEESKADKPPQHTAPLPPLPSGRPWIIAELSGNHNQSLERAMQLIEAAAAAGVDAVKLQTYTPDSMTLNLDHERFRIGTAGTPWDGETLYSLYTKGQTPWEWHAPLFRRAAELGLVALSTPFDAAAVDFLESLDTPIYKIASFENTDLPLIERVAATGKPIILSTGMATIAEIDEAVRTAREAGCSRLILLRCTSAYPAPPDESHLLTLPHMRELFGCPVGLSDHTLGTGVAVASVALGAIVIEKHLTLDRSEGGVDAAFSLEPDEMRALVTEVHRAWKALGRVSYGPTKHEQESLKLRRSLYVVDDLRTGDVLNEQNVRSIRPGGGLPPKYLPLFLGKTVARDVPRGTPLTWDLLSRDDQPDK